MKDVTPGATIGPYKIGPQLNTGGMGMVFKAHKVLDNGEAINVAIKFPRLAVVHDDEVLQGFRNEAEVMAKFRCSRIPKIDTWGIHEGLPYVVMQLLSGVSLRQFLDELSNKRKQLDFELAAHIFREVALALNYAHVFTYAGRRMNVLHRDMASKNVMIDGSGDVYLIDFGIVRSEETLQRGASSASIIKGTLNYLAPEHAAGEPCAASDVFGLHTILWEMLEGRTFRTGFGQQQLWAEAMQGNVPPLTRENVPGFLRTLIERGLHPDPEERIKLSDVLTLLEEHSKPRNVALKALFTRHFELLARRSGSTIVDEGFEVPSELFKTMAAAKAVHNPLGPPTLDPADIPPDPDPASVLPTVKPRRPHTPSGLPVALAREEDERPPPQAAPAPQANQPTPIPSTERLRLHTTDAEVRDERGYTVPLMQAIEEVEPPPHPRPATEILPTPPELPTTTANTTTAEDTPVERTLRRWPLVVAATIATGALAALTAFVIIGNTSEIEGHRTASPPRETAPQKPRHAPPEQTRQKEAPSPPLEIPDPAEPQPQEAPAPIAAPQAAPAPEAPTAEEPPEPETAPEQSNPTPTAPGTSKLTLRAGFSRAEIQVRGKTIDLSSTKTLKVRAGSVKVRWRFPPDKTWSQKRILLKQGRSYVVQVEKSGLRLQEGRR